VAPTSSERLAGATVPFPALEAYTDRHDPTGWTLSPSNCFEPETEESAGFVFIVKSGTADVRPGIESALSRHVEVVGVDGDDVLHAFLLGYLGTKG
jgi:hypothetical protein